MIKNYKLRTINCRQKRLGYTLIELLVVLGILAITVGGILMFLTSTLKGTNKTNAETEVKQNGQAVLDSLERQIRGAVSVQLIGANHDYIRIIRDSAQPLNIRCESLNSQHTSRIAIQESSSPTSGGWSSISNDNLVSGMSVSNCQFNVYDAGFSPDGKAIPAVVSISFDAQKAGERADLSATSRKFQTTISLRNY